MTTGVQRQHHAVLDQLYRSIINRLQDGFPLIERPFKAVAEEIGCDEHQLIERIERLRAAGVLTRFGPFFDAEAMGGAFCLCALAVPSDRFDAVTEIVNAHPEVAHNYERDHALNMWFVLAAETLADIERTIAEIRSETGLDVLQFPKLEEYFIGFKVAA